MLCFIATMQSKPGLVGGDCPTNLYSPTQDFIGITSQIMEKGSSIDLDLFFMVAWSIRGNRNNAIHNDAGCPLTQVWKIAKRSLIDFTISNLHDHPSHPMVKAHWSPPPPSFHKINVDGATTNNGEHSSIRVIIQDHTGPLLELSTSCFHKLFLILSLRLSLCYKESFLLQK